MQVNRVYIVLHLLLLLQVFILCCCYSSSKHVCESPQNRHFSILILNTENRRSYIADFLRKITFLVANLTIIVHVSHTADFWQRFSHS